METLRADKKYKVIYADPPWGFKYQSEVNRTSRYKRVEHHYPVMELSEIKALPVKGISDKDCVLFMWVTYPFLNKAFEVIDSWGFKYKTVAFTWVKTNKDKSIFRGMGYWTMANAEICLLATKGKPKRIACDVPQVILSQRQKHSKKPDEIRDRIVRLIGDVERVELFARQKTHGWDVWGNEVERDIEIEGHLQNAFEKGEGSVGKNFLLF